MIMKMSKLALLAVCMAGTAVPAFGQALGFDGINFVKAVREKDGDKALPLQTSRPNVVNARDTNGDTPLTITIGRRDDTWTYWLLDKGANPDLPGRNGDTPLIIAARVGFIEAAEQLLARDAKIDAANGSGETALIVAVQQRQRDIAKLLLDNGADPDKHDHAAGYSAREYAKRDVRSRDILALIEAAKKPAAPVKKVENANDFKL
ncbi:MAG: ankyrin repeat domain-containing protein [Sphingomicrobium sp.]